MLLLFNVVVKNIELLMHPLEYELLRNLVAKCRK